VEPNKALIIEEHTKVREALAARLSKSDQIQLIGTCDSIQHGLECIVHYQPDIVLLGLKVEHDERETDNISQMVIKLGEWGGALIVLTTYAVEKERDAILRAGARRYLLKDLDMPHLMDEINRAVTESASYARRAPRGDKIPPEDLPSMD
jgi:DNA-binding NarL/FixJ family response regulator